jgi:hypothetical protein
VARAISVSTDVFAAIWRDRRDDEADEDAILRRHFGVLPTTINEPERDMTVQVGYHDPKFGVSIPSGFKIFRTYKQQEYTAQAIQGFWVLNTTGKGYPTLHQLNQAIRPGNENAWNVWFYRDENNRRRPVSDLRDPSKIVRRVVTLEDLP